MFPHKAVQLLPPDLCSGYLPTVKLYHGPLDGPSLRHCCSPPHPSVSLEAATKRSIPPKP